MTVRAGVPEHIIESRIIPIARRLSVADAMVLGEVLVAKGIPVVEVTMDGEDAEASIRELTDMGLSVGAGTVFTLPEANAALKAGASFLVSPHTDPDLILYAQNREVPIFPGAVTPTEVRTAWTLGASAIKLFPASMGGPGLLATLRGPFSDVPFIPTGGIDAGNAGDYLAAGAVAVGVGSWLTAVGDAEAIADRAEQLRRITLR
jgi:2-dehydro-3-deoxyphosphogluconate aldolase/(4S)-4-hydroxy-2-oxoglutarate aldolase